MLRILFTFLLAALLLPLSVGAQTWSDDEQSAIDHILACWEAAFQEDWDLWTSECNPSQDLIYWQTSDAAPTEGYEYWRKINEVWWNDNDIIAYDMRPYRVRLYGDVAALYFYAVGQTVDGAGKITPASSYRLELLRMVDGRWQLLGGIAVPLPQ